MNDRNEFEQIPLNDCYLDAEAVIFKSLCNQFWVEKRLPRDLAPINIPLINMPGIEELDAMNEARATEFTDLFDR